MVSAGNAQTPVVSLRNTGVDKQYSSKVKTGNEAKKQSTSTNWLRASEQAKE